jgi:hypothetical protein
MAIETNVQVIRTFTRAFENEHNVDAIEHLFSSNFRHNFPPPLRAEAFKVSKKQNKFTGDAHAHDCD